MVVRYQPPRPWITYDPYATMQPLLEAKAAVLALVRMPYQRSWAERLQEVQLKREVAGTSRIEGAEFTEQELEQSVRTPDSPAQLATRSQRQAAAAVRTYRWIAVLQGNEPVDVRTICEVHRRLVTDCDDDHCPPGRPRGADQNVTFGVPRHPGVEGGDACFSALNELAQATGSVFRAHDPLIQALALHYHIAAMHPFLDGNGRTARAMEALMLQRAGLRDTLFIAMSNYYYEEKIACLEALNATREAEHDLTPFLQFALRGIRVQCEHLFEEIRLGVSRALYRTTVADLFGRLTSPRKRVMSARHVQLLNLLLEEGAMSLGPLIDRVLPLYAVKNAERALLRDLRYLLQLGAVVADVGAGDRPPTLGVNLDWPAQITETEFFRRAKELPKGKLFGFLSK